MSDPARLVHRPTLDGTLLRAARREVPPARAHKRMLSTLGIGTTAATAATAKSVAAAMAVAKAKSAATGVTTAMFAKWTLIGAVGALATIGAVREMPVLLGQGSRPAAVPAPNTTTSPRRKVAKAPAVGEPAPAQSSAVPKSDAGFQATATRSTRSSASPAVSGLAAEVSALDRARAATDAHDPGGALALLDAYQRRFPNGSLQPEAQLLRVEALVQQGRRSQALPIARRLLDAAPDGPLSERVQRIFPELR